MIGCRQAAHFGAKTLRREKQIVKRTDSCPFLYGIQVKGLMPDELGVARQADKCRTVVMRDCVSHITLAANTHTHTHTHTRVHIHTHTYKIIKGVPSLKAKRMLIEYMA